MEKKSEPGMGPGPEMGKFKEVFMLRSYAVWDSVFRPTISSP